MSELYLVLPSNSSMVTHPNNTLAQYITNLPRRISLSGHWECGLTEMHVVSNRYTSIRASSNRASSATILHSHFATALEYTVNVVVYVEFEAVLEIDKGRNIIYNY